MLKRIQPTHRCCIGSDWSFASSCRFARSAADTIVLMHRFCTEDHFHKDQGNNTLGPFRHGAPRGLGRIVASENGVANLLLNLV